MGMATEDDVRRIALELSEVTERLCYGTPAFYVAGKIFARFHDQPGVLVLWCASVEERQELLDSAPEVFCTTDHYRGHASVLVRLEQIGAEELAELLDEAWRFRGPRRLTDPKS
ncbi:MmcQ/YjbR family DNA-binding protein [Nocardiopsis nanhaiensis]